MIYRLDEKIALALQSAYDPETGELKEDVTEEALFQEIARLNVEHEELLDNLTSEIKNLTAEAESIKAEKLSLEKRQSIVEKHRDRSKRLLAYLLNGDTFKNGRHSVSYRRTEEIVPDEEFILWASQNREDLLRYKDPEPDKRLIKEAIRNGDNLEHVTVNQKKNLIVK